MVCQLQDSNTIQQIKVTVRYLADYFVQSNLEKAICFGQESNPCLLLRKAAMPSSVPSILYTTLAEGVQVQDYFQHAQIWALRHENPTSQGAQNSLWWVYSIQLSDEQHPFDWIDRLHFDEDNAVGALVKPWVAIGEKRSVKWRPHHFKANMAYFSLPIK